MQLWNDYEGKTIAGVYTLGPLLRPEGRSALFSLPTGKDAPAILRLTESLNDEGQMLACWRDVQKIEQPNLLPLKAFGDAVLEGIPLTYAVMEAPDVTLDELLKERPMTTAEALQVATSVVPALQALHARELVHEHILPDNVVAVGETVKLRADCVRVCRVDADLVTAADCAEMRQRDVEQLALLLIRALTLEKKLRPGLVLAAPFNRIIPNALNGMWGLAEIAAALPAPVPPIQPVPAPQPAVTPMPVPATAKVNTPAAVSEHRAAAAPSPGNMPAPWVADRVAETAQPAVQGVDAVARAAAREASEASRVADAPLMFQRRIQTPVAERSRKPQIVAALALAAVLLFAFLLHVIHSNSGSTPQSAIVGQPAAQQAVRAPQANPELAANHEAKMASTPARPASPADPAPVPVAARVQPGWYVIAYTFNHEQQALKRAEAIVRRHPYLHPQVIAPHGREFLIALGGAMSRDEAENIRNSARRAGMPRDTFVRNYGS